MSFLSQLDWRYATKQFDTTRKVTPEDLSEILRAIRLTPTSFGLQPYHFYVVSDSSVLQQMQAASYDQPQVGTASHVIVFCTRSDLSSVRESFFSLLSGGDATLREQLAGYEGMVRGFLDSSDETRLAAWTARQAYIAHGFALAALAELQIDSCAMEGFDPQKIAEILSLPSHLTPVVMLPIGYRDPSDIQRPKARFSHTDLFTMID